MSTGADVAVTADPQSLDPKLPAGPTVPFVLCHLPRLFLCHEQDTWLPFFFSFFTRTARTRRNPPFPSRKRCLARPQGRRPPAP